MPQIPDYIQTLQTQFEAETQPFKKVHRLIDLCEAVIKFHTVVILSNFMESMAKNTHSQEDIATARGILAQGLKTPSLGIWAFFTEKIFPLIPGDDLFWEDFPLYFEKTLKKASAEIIPFRNSYAHGSTPDDKECLADIQKILPHLDKILKGGIVDRYDLRVGEVIKGTRVSWIVSLEKEGRSLVLSPLLVYRDSEKGVVVRQAHHDTMGGSTGDRSTKKSSTGLSSGGSTGSPTDANKSFPGPVEGTDTQKSNTNPNSGGSTGSPTGAKISFPESVEGTDIQNSNTNPSSGGSTGSPTGAKKSVPEHVEGTIPKRFFYFNDLRNEKKISLLNYDASEHIRDEELKKAFDEIFPLKSWEKKSVSPFKSRIEELTENFKGRREELKQLETFFREKAKGHFFIWGGPGIGKSTLVARALQLSRASQEKGGATEEEAFAVGKDIHFIEYFIRRGTDHARTTTYLKYMSEEMERVQSMGIPTGVGQDEMGEKYFEKLRTLSEKLEEKNKKLVLFIDGLDEADDGFLRYLPMEGYKQILVVLSTRELPLTREIYLRILENKEEITLHGLGTDVIRALLYDVVDKYDIQKEYIDGILTKSEGNPLYLRLLLNSLAEKEKKLNDISALPKGVYDFYQEILDRLNKSRSGADIDDVLYLLTITKDFLSADTISYFTGIKRNKVDIILSDIREILFENPFTEEVEDFQLFHESLREFFKEKYPKQLIELRDSHLFPKLRNWKAEYTTYKKDKTDFYTIRYILSYTVSHFLESQETLPEAETLVLSKDYVVTQLDVLQFYTIPLRDAGLALKQIVTELGGKPCTTRPLSEILKPKKSTDEKFRTTTFVQLVNHTGELSHKASTDIGIAWKWIEEGKVAEALERLSPIQDKQRLFDCYLLALWLLALQPDGEANRAGLKLVLEEVEKNIPPAESKTVKWHERYSVLFFGEMCKTLLMREQVVKGVFDRGSDEQKKDVILACLGCNVSGEEAEFNRSTKNIEFLKNNFHILITLNNRIENITIRNELYCIIGELISKISSIDFANSLLPMLIKLAHEIEDSYSYSWTLCSIGKSVSIMGNLELGESLFYLALSKVHELPYHLRSYSLINIGKAISTIGNLELGKIFFPILLREGKKIESYIDRCRLLYNLGNSVSKIGDVELGNRLLHEAIDVARNIEGLYARSLLLSFIGESLFKLDDVELSRHIFNESINVAIQIMPYTERIKAFRNIGECIGIKGNIYLDVDLILEAVKVIHLIENSSLRCSAYRIIGEMLVLQGNLDLSKNLFKKSIDIAGEIENPSLRSEALISIAESVSKLRDVKLGRSVFPALVELARDIESSEYCSRSLISIGESVSSLWDVELGRSLFPLLVNLSYGIESSEYCSRSLSSIGESVSSLGDVELGCSLFQKALELTKAIENFHDKSSSLQLIGESICKLGDLDLGYRIFPMLVDVAKDIEDSYYRSSSLISIGESVNKLGHMELCRSLFPVMLDVARGVVDSENCCRLLTEICELKIIQRDIDLVIILNPVLLEIARGIEDKYYRTVALSTTGKFMSNLGDLKFSLNLFHESLELASRIEDSYYCSSSMRLIGESVSKLGDMKMVRTLFLLLRDLARGIENLKFRSTTLSNLGELLYRLGEVDLGLSLFQEAIEVFTEILDTANRCETLICFTESISKLRDVKLGRILIPVVLDFDFKIDDSLWRGVVLNHIILLLSDLNDMNLWKNISPSIVEIANGINEDHARSDLFRKIVISLCKMGELELNCSLLYEALEITREIEFSSDCSYSLTCIGESVSKIGDVEFGRSLFPLMVEVARGIESSSDRSKALSRIGESVSKLGDVEFGRSLIQEAIEVSRGIEDSNSRSSSLSSIGESVSKLGDVELGRSLFQESVEVARGIEDSSSRSSSLSTIGESVSILGESDLSKQILPQILELGYKLKVSDERKNVLQSIAKATATFGSTTAYSFFETNHESHPDIPEVVKAYTEEYRKIQWEESKSQELFSYYIRSFGWVPYDGEFAKTGVYDVISTLAKLGKIDEALEAGRGIGMIPEAPSSTEDEYARELAELDKLLEDEEITKKGYDKRVLELKGKYGI